jgi:prephenate dehydratase
MGNYFFSIDALGHIRERRMQAALTGLNRTCREVTFLGSYPGVDQPILPIKSGNRDSDFAKSDAWLREILG